MGQFHNTVESKLKFVKGEVTTEEPSEGYVACGEGSKYPMLVTPDEMSAVHYRVYDCRIGTKDEDVFSYDARDSGLGLHNYEVKSNGIDPGSQFVETIFNTTTNYEENFSSRGVWVATYPGYTNPLLTPDFLAVNFSAGYSIDGSSSTYYDLLEAEHHAWCNGPNPSTDPALSGTTLYVAGSAMTCYVKTGDLTQTSQQGLTVFDNYPSSPGIEGEVTAYVNIGRKVAYVNADPDAGPFDAGSTLYLELTASIQVVSNGVDEVFDDFSWMYVSTDSKDESISLGGLGGDTVKKSSAFLVLRLTTGSNPVEVKCPFYMAQFDAGTGFEADCWGQLTVEATKWYPFARGDGNPAWDAANGKSL